VPERISKRRGHGKDALAPNVACRSLVRETTRKHHGVDLSKAKWNRKKNVKEQKNVLAELQLHPVAKGERERELQ
jgi:hypothetical protein